jgi:hypothetical protein
VPTQYGTQYSVLCARCNRLHSQPPVQAHPHRLHQVSRGRQGLESKRAQCGNRSSPNHCPALSRSQPNYRPTFPGKKCTMAPALGMSQLCQNLDSSSCAISAAPTAADRARLRNLLPVPPRGSCRYCHVRLGSGTHGMSTKQGPHIAIQLYKWVRLGASGSTVRASGLVRRPHDIRGVTS